jgi:methylenetetrahydrofolate reductase (NADPH)
MQPRSFRIVEHRGDDPGLGGAVAFERQRHGLVSQLFFDNQDFEAFVRRARSSGISVPIVPGLMPVTNVAQTQRFTQMCGARIPHELERRLKIVANDPAAVVATGVQWTVDQGRSLLRAGAPGLHFYTLNRSSATLAVHAALGL